jgi:hypothetical protein
VFRLTQQEQKVLGLVLALLLVGWAVRVYRAAHPPAAGPAPTGATTHADLHL